MILIHCADIILMVIYGYISTTMKLRYSFGLFFKYVQV